VPYGVTVVRINPSIVTLNFEMTLQKRVPVRPRLVGRPAPNHEVAEVTVEPAEVRIAGPKSRVQEVESAFTEPVSVDGATSNVTDAVNLGLEDPVLRTLDSPSVMVTARIQEVETTRTLAGLPVEVRGGRATLRPGAVDVVLRGPASALARLAPESVRPYVDLAPLAGAHTAAVTVELSGVPAGVAVERSEPDHVAIRPAGAGKD